MSDTQPTLAEAEATAAAALNEAKADDAGLLSIDVEVPGQGVKTLRFKSLRTLPIGLVRRTRHNLDEQMWQAFEWAFSEDDLAVFDAIHHADLYPTLAKMQEASGITLGGIAGLADVIDEHGEALEADLIRLGHRLRWYPSAEFDWRDLFVIVRRSHVESELYKAMHPDEAGWTLTNLLLATIADCLRWLQWSKTKDGVRGRNVPDPIKRPGVGTRRKPVHARKKGAKRGAPLSKIRKLLGRDNSARTARAEQLETLFSDK